MAVDRAAGGGFDAKGAAIEGEVDAAAAPQPDIEAGPQAGRPHLVDGECGLVTLGAPSSFTASIHGRRQLDSLLPAE